MDLNRGIIRGLMASVWAVIGMAAGVMLAIWWDRAAARHQTPSLNGWGAVFAISLVVLLVGIYGAYRLAVSDENEWAIAVSVVCTALLTFLLSFVAPTVGWAASLRLAGLILGPLCYLAVAWWIASGDRQ